MNHNDVLNKLFNLLDEKRSLIEGISQYSGGWEGWLQCELSMCWDFGVVEREVALWGDKRAADLWFPKSKYCVELKCLSLNRAYKKGNNPLHISDIESTYSGFADDALEDIKKIGALPEEAGGCAIIVIPTWLTKHAFALLKDKLSSETYYWQEKNGFWIGTHKREWL